MSKYRYLTVLLALSLALCLSSCFKDEPLNAECDIEQAYLRAGDHLGSWFLFDSDTLPKVFTGWYKYKAGPQFTDRFMNVLEQRDYGTIYAVLYDNHNAKGEAICLYGDNVQTSDRVVALARLDNIDDTPEWTPFTLNFIYRKAVDAQKLRTGGYSLAVVCSSSTSGAEFMGAVGSTLWVDQFRVVCE